PGLPPLLRRDGPAAGVLPRRGRDLAGEGRQPRLPVRALTAQANSLTSKSSRGCQGPWSRGTHCRTLRGKSAAAIRPAVRTTKPSEVSGVCLRAHTARLSDRL